MTFKIVVCIKQVPDTNDIKWTPMNTIQREGMDLVMNPYDLGAIQAALDVKKIFNDSEIILVSMGPHQAVESLRYGLALGADKAYLLCDKKFAASDTLATAYCLSCFVNTHVRDFKLIVCGQQAVDGDTAQTPTAMAEKLGIPSVTLVKEIIKINREQIVLKRELPLKTMEVEVAQPCLIAVDNQSVQNLPKIEDFMRAQDEEIEVLTACEIGSEDCNIGIKGSPTQVKKAFRPMRNREGKVFEDMTNEAFMELLMSEINKAKQ